MAKSKGWQNRTDRPKEEREIPYNRDNWNSKHFRNVWSFDGGRLFHNNLKFLALIFFRN